MVPPTEKEYLGVVNLRDPESNWIRDTFQGKLVKLSLADPDEDFNYRAVLFNTTGPYIALLYSDEVVIFDKIL